MRSGSLQLIESSLCLLEDCGYEKKRLTANNSILMEKNPIQKTFYPPDIWTNVKNELILLDANGYTEIFKHLTLNSNNGAVRNDSLLYVRNRTAQSIEI